MSNSHTQEEMPFVERDVSWLSFNERVLQEAKDPDVPLYERLRFLAIYSSNLDEFFRVRVASLRSFKKMKKKARRLLDIKPKKILKKVHQIVNEQQKEFGRIFSEMILPELAAGGVHLVGEKDFSEPQADFVRRYFFEQVQPLLRPVFVDEKVYELFLQNKTLYLVVQMDESAERLAVVNIPADALGRFVTLPGVGTDFFVTFLDDVIRFCWQEVFPEQPISGIFAVKISRDAELYLGDEYSGDLLDKLKKGLRKREDGLPTRFLYDQAMPDILLKRLKTLFRLSKHDLMPGAKYHNFNDFFSFPDPGNHPEWHHPALPPLPHPVLRRQESLLEAIQKQEFLLHFPYQSFQYIPQLIWEAAENPMVKKIKITLYRVASRSEVTAALLAALKKGKIVTVFMEVKARFDENSNLYWGERLQEAGAQVIYSYPGIKVHTKLLLIQLAKQNKLASVNIAYLGTGNFNEKTATIYGDHALLTSSPQLTSEVAQVFELLERKIIIPNTRRLLVSPFTTRVGLERLINREIAMAKAGKKAWLTFKMNSLEDQQMIKKLYEASTAGVKVRLIVRGICSLVPGVEGWSENITVVSIVDRFLEHARIFDFGNDGHPQIYLASADLMTRNLDRRVEVVFPIEDNNLQSELRQIMDFQWRDNQKARFVNGLLANKYRKNQQEPVRSQIAIYRWLESKVVSKDA